MSLDEGASIRVPQAGRRYRDAQEAQAWHRRGIDLVGAGKLPEAQDALERALALDAASSEAHNNLGIVLQRQGKLEGARAQYEAALTLAPLNGETRSNLASVLGALGLHREGLAEAERAIVLRPEWIGAHVHAALIEIELGRLDAALARIEPIALAASENADILIVHAQILGALDREEEALDVCQRAVALRPGDGNCLNQLGLLFEKLGRDDDALRCYAQAAALLPRPGVALANQAALLIQLGRSEEADAILKRTLALDPDCAAAWYTRAMMKRYRALDPDLDAMEAVLQENRASSYTERMCLHFALGGAYLDSGDGERAFAHLGKGAGMKRGLLSYDGAATERWMDEIAAAFPAALYATNPKGRLTSELPVFVVGMPRSGTTLIEQILGSHPRIHPAGELGWLEQAVGRALGSRDPRAFPSAFAPEYATAIATDYLARLASLDTKAERIVDKMMSNLVYVGLIHLMLPRARIILCRRDPIDTCLSCYSKLFTRGQEFSYDLAELGRYFRAQDALATHWRNVLPADIFLEVHYESLVADFDGAAQRLVSFCGLPWSPDCLAFHQTQRPIRTASTTQVRRPIYNSSVGRWRQFRHHLAPLVEALGTAFED